MPQCTICSKDNNTSYKCSKCRIPYCSVECYKIHKNDDCEPVKVEIDKPDTSTKHEFITHDTVPAEKLKLLVEDKNMCEILNNRHVRDILNYINSCDNPNESLEQAMKEPIFTEFVDACMRITSDK